MSDPRFDGPPSVIGLLKATSGFAGLSDVTIADLAALIEDIHLPAGGVLCCGPVDRRELVVVAGGGAVVSDGRVVGRLAPGARGGSFILHNGRRTAVAIHADTAMRLLAIGTKAVRHGRSCCAVANAMSVQLSPRRSSGGSG